MKLNYIHLLVNQVKIRIFNLCRSANKDLTLITKEINYANCIVDKDIKSQSERWEYPDTDMREEGEDLEMVYNLHLINKLEDKLRCCSRRWCSSSTPGLAFCAGDILHKIIEIEQLGGTDYRPVKYVQYGVCSTKAKAGITN